MTSNRSFANSGEDRRSTAEMEVDEEEEEDVDEEFIDEPGGIRIGDIYIPPPPPKADYCGDVSGKRLIITHIENINFKSYAGVQRLGPFQKSFTSIVGPNGSGKSNVIDSMLFVFGYRAQRLRCKKLGILIHNSAKYPNLDTCQVNVHFAIIVDKPGDDYDIVEGSQFTVSRVAKKDNSSYYQINGKRVQFKDVSELLQSHGIDLRYNRFLILQGEVEQIALMKAKADTEHETGMLEFLEDIIGTTRLKEPLNLLAKKVEETNVQRSEKMNRVKVVEKELKTLEDARNEAIKFLETENKILNEKSNLYQIKKAEANEDKEEAQKEFDRANDILQKALETVNALKKERDEKEEELKNVNKEFTAICKKAEELSEKYKEYERIDLQMRDKLKNTRTRGKKIESDLENENKKLQDLESRPVKIKDEIELLEAKKNKAEIEFKSAEENLAKVMGEIKNDTEPLKKRKDELEVKLLDMQKGVNEARSNLEIAQSELDLYKSRERTEKAQLDQMKLKLEKSIGESEAKRNALHQYETEIPKCEKKMQKLQSELDKLESEREKVAHEHQLQNDKLEEMKHSSAAFTSRNKVLNALMEQKRKGTIKGIFGRLGDLGAIDAKYDVAISTACGSLDNIVTDTMDSAQKCVQFLKDNNIGSGNFIGLDKMRTDWREGETFPEGVPRLFDLIRVNDERVRPAFYFAIRDTLVANDMEQASRIAYGQRRYRVVTLDGKLIEQSGTMSGGGQPSRGKMGSNVAVMEVNTDELRLLETKVSELRNKLSDIKERSESVRREFELANRDVITMNQNRPQYEMEVKRFDELQSALKKGIIAQEKKTQEAAPDPNQTKELETKMSAEKKKYEKEHAKCTEYEDEVESLNDKIKEIMDKKVGTARKKVDELKGDLNRLNSEINKLNNSLKTTQRNIEKCKEKLKGLEEEKEEALEVLKTTKEEMRKLEELATSCTKEYEEASNEKEVQDAKIKSIQKEITRCKTQESKLNSENVDAKHEMEQQKNKLNEMQEKVNVWNGKLKELEFHEIEGKAKPTVTELTKEEIASLNISHVQKEINKLENELKSMKPNMAAIAEYKKKITVYSERARELEEATKQRDLYKSQYEQVRTQRKKEFGEGFLIIARKLKEMYRMITMGGDADLEYADSLDPFSEGINFVVRPNKKSWKRMTNLSGGEKTLSSLSLIFALHYYKPSPLYVMDEIDAALDFKNVSIVANYIKERTRNTQFIIISLRNNMYELADRLVGIYKIQNCTRSVAINPSKIEEKRLGKKLNDLNTSFHEPTVTTSTTVTSVLTENNSQRTNISEPDPVESVGVANEEQINVPINDEADVENSLTVN